MLLGFYALQVALLKDMLSRDFPHRDIECLTVDRSQGKEMPHVILSSVRSNSQGNIGFCADPRRLCVAIGRAKVSLTIVGNLKTLSSNSNWRRVGEDIQNIHLLPTTAAPGQSMPIIPDQACCPVANDFLVDVEEEDALSSNLIPDQVSTHDLGLLTLATIPEVPEVEDATAKRPRTESGSNTGTV